MHPLSTLRVRDGVNHVPRPMGKGFIAKTIHIGTLLLVLALIAALIAVVIVVTLVRSGVSVHKIVTGSAGVPGAVVMGIVGAFAIVPAVMWLIFPWLVCSRLSKIYAELLKIENNIQAIQSRIKIDSIDSVHSVETSPFRLVNP
jgi:hypothetical protein